MACRPFIWKCLMPIFENILIATDGSEKNQPAVKKGLDIARHSGALVYAVYVIDETPFGAAQPEVMTDDLYTKLNSEGNHAVQRVKEGARDVDIETVVLTGRPAHAITEYARKKGVDLIVVGSQGKSGIERLILGSIAESIIRTADCMVLVVKK